MDENKKKLRRMAIWMIAVFATAFAIVLAVLYLAAKGSILTALAGGWWLILILAVVCILAYYIYKLIVNKKK